MSRCFPFPPPGYEKIERSDEGPIESIEKERERAKKEKRKEKKRAKKEKKEKSRDNEKKDKEHNSEKEDEKTAQASQKRVEESEQSKKIGLAEEHGQQVNMQNLYDSSEKEKRKEKKRKREKEKNEKSRDKEHNIEKEDEKTALVSQKRVEASEQLEKGILTEEQGQQVNTQTLYDSSEKEKRNEKKSTEKEKSRDKEKKGKEHNTKKDDEKTAWASRKRVEESEQLEKIGFTEEHWQQVNTQNLYDSSEKEKRNEKKSTKKEKKEKSRDKEKKGREHNTEKDEKTASSRKGEEDSEQLEKSGLTEEHGQQVNIQNLYDSSDSTQHSGKRKRLNSPTCTGYNHGSVVLRIRLPLQKHEDPGPSNINKGPSTSILDPGPSNINEGPYTSVLDPGPSNVSEGPSTSGRTETLVPDIESTETVPRSSFFEESSPMELEARRLIGDWNPPPLQFEHPDHENLEWLLEKNHQSAQPEVKRRKVNEGFSSIDESYRNFGLAPRACYMPEADIYALPFTVPF